MTVHVMIAAPGAGKSRLSKELIKDGGAICSADSYFQRWLPEPSYEFDSSKLSEAHGECLRKFTEILYGLSLGVVDCENVVVDNTNSSLVEIAPYYSLAAAYGHSVTFHRFLANRHVLEHEFFPRNVHGVSLETVMAIGKRVWELEFPKFWKFQLIDHGMTKTES